MRSVFIFLAFFTSVLVDVSAFAEAGSTKTFPGDSLYQLKTEWKNQDNKTVKLEDFAGHPVLISMVYLTCTFSCPTVISEIQAITAKLPKEIKDQLKVLLVSFDPKRDTPAKMKAYVKKRKLPLDTWTLVTNNLDVRIRELAAALNFKYEKSGEEFTHSFVIAVLDQSGVIKARVDAVNQDKEEILKALK